MGIDWVGGEPETLTKPRDRGRCGNMSEEQHSAYLIRKQKYIDYKDAEEDVVVTQPTQKITTAGSNTDNVKVTNGRRLPADDEFLKNRAVSDILYAYLQSISGWNEEEITPCNTYRFIMKRDFTLTDVAKVLCITPKTVKRQLDNLIEAKVVDETDIAYKLVYDSSKRFFIPHVDVLKQLYQTLQKDVIKTYCILGNIHYFAIKKGGQTQRGCITKGELLERLGIYPDDHTYAKISTIVDTLVRLKLVQVVEIVVNNDNNMKIKAWEIVNVAKSLEKVNIPKELGVNTTTIRASELLGSSTKRIKNTKQKLLE